MTKLIMQSPRDRRRKRIRSKIFGTALRPRLSFFKSNTRMVVQLINDDESLTLAGATGTDPKKLGEEIAKQAKAKGVEEVVLDRGGYIYTGKVKIFAEAAREAGLKF